MKNILYTVILLSFNMFEMKLLVSIYEKPQIVQPLEYMSLFSSQTLCFWMDQTVFDIIVQSHLKSMLHFYNMSVVIVDYNKVNVSAKMCADNVVFLTGFIHGSKFYNDRPPTVQNVFLVIDTEINLFPLNMWNETMLTVFGSAKVILLWNSQIFKLSSPYFLPRRFILLKSLSMHEDETVLSLKGRKVNVATFNCSLFSIMKDSSNFDAHDGIEMRMLKELAHKVNFTPSLVELKGVGKWGLMLANGSWVGGVAGALEAGDADLGFCNVWAVLRYINSFDFGPQWNMIYHTYMVPRPKMVRGFWVVILQLFKRSVWILLFTTFVLITILYWKFKESNSNGLQDAVESVLTAYGVFIATTSHLPPSTVRFSQHVITSWSVFSFFICSIISNTIITRLMIPHLSTLIDSVEDIVSNNYLWGEPGYINESKRNIYFNIDDPWQLRLEANYRFLTKNTSRAALYSGKFVFPVQRLGQEYIFVNVDGLETMDFKGFRVISQVLNQFYSGFAFSKHSPLIGLCYRPLLIFIESGLTQHWKKDVILKHGRGLVKYLLSEPSTESVDSFKPLTISSNMAAFQILITGLVLAILTFISELLFSARCKLLKRENKNKIVQHLLCD